MTWTTSELSRTGDFFNFFNFVTFNLFYFKKMKQFFKFYRPFHSTEILVRLESQKQSRNGLEQKLRHVKDDSDESSLPPSRATFSLSPSLSLTFSSFCSPLPPSAAPPPALQFWCSVVVIVRWSVPTRRPEIFKSDRNRFHSRSSEIKFGVVLAQIV